MLEETVNFPVKEADTEGGKPTVSGRKVFIDHMAGI